MDYGKCSPLTRKAAYNDYHRCTSLHCSHPLRWNEFLCLIPTFIFTFYTTEQFHLHCRVWFPHHISRNILQNKSLVIFHWLSYQMQFSWCSQNTSQRYQPPLPPFTSEEKWKLTWKLTWAWVWSATVLKVKLKRIKTPRHTLSSYLSIMIIYHESNSTACCSTLIGLKADYKY